MGGVDTIRGITYQHVCVISACLDVLEDSNCSAIRVEWGDEIVDFDVIDVAGTPIRTVQVKTKIEPYTWSTRELVDLFACWNKLPGRSNVYEFLSDGQLSASAVKLVALPLAQVRAGRSGSEIDALKDVGLAEFPDDFLRRIRVKTRHGDTRLILESAEMRLLRVSEQCRRTTSEEVSALIDTLFRSISIRSGSREESERLFSREELATALRVDIEALDTATGWTHEVADRYRKAITAIPPSTTVILEALLDSATHPALELTKPSVRDHQGDTRHSIDALPSVFSRCTISGSAGSGKTTALELLLYQAAQGGGLPVLVTPMRYTEGELGRLIREALEEATGLFLAPGTSDAVVACGEFLLLVDGLTERPLIELNQLRADLRELMTAVPNVRVFVSGRHAEGFRLAGFPSLSLEGLRGPQRQELAAMLLDSADDVPAIVRHVESVLGSAVTNPLLFTMALSLSARGHEITSRASLYRGMVEGLWARQTSDEPEELVEETLSRLAARLVEAGHFSANRYNWLSLASDILGDIQAEGRVSPRKLDAEDVLDIATRSGLLRTPTVRRDINFLHDSFRDYFASVAFGRRTVPLPDQITEEHEESISIMAEEVGVSEEFVLQAAAQNPIAACRIAPFVLGGERATAASIARTTLSILNDNHLGKYVIQQNSLANIGVRLCWTPTHSWILLASTGVEDVVDDLNALAPDRPDAVLVAAHPGHLGPVELACEVWKSLAAAAIDRFGLPDPLWSRSSFGSPEEIAEHVLQRAEQRQMAIREIAPAVLPSVSKRLLDLVGPTGLRAEIEVGDPSDRKSWGFSMSYYYEYGPCDVQIVDVSSKAESTGNWGRTSAEHYLEVGAWQMAREELRKALARMLSESDE